MNIDKYRIKPNKKINLSEFSTSDTGKYKSKDDASKALKKNIKKMSELQDKLYADNRYALLIIFQAMDAAGKDGTIKHVMSGLNPQGTQVTPFKQPTAIDLDHDYLWRINAALPERGRIGIFNRSHYEEVLVVRVKNLLFSEKSQLPKELITDDIWERRFKQIVNYEKYLAENGIIILKFFLHISKEEQKKRFLERIENPAKNWKFSEADIIERSYWNDYQKAYEEAISATSKNYAPWYVIPADNKWFARLLVSEIIVETLKKLDLKYPELSHDKLQNLEKFKEILLNEKD